MRHGLAHRLAVATAATAAILPLGAGAAAACDGGHHAQPVAATYAVRSVGAQHDGLAVVSSYLGLSPATILQDLRSGESLAHIADATPGKSATGLVDAIVGALKARLDAAVAAGTLGAAQETAILDRVTPWIQRLVDRTWTGSWHDRDHAFAVHWLRHR